MSSPPSPCRPHRPPLVILSAGSRSEPTSKDSDHMCWAEAPEHGAIFSRNDGDVL
jgi:hypothetical protein